MKFAVLVFVVSCCLVAANTKPTGELIDIDDTFSHTSSIRCLIRKIGEIRKLINDTVTSLHKCGTETTKEVRELIANLRRALKIIQEINEIVKNDCQNGGHHVIKCQRKIKRKIAELIRVLDRVSGLIKDIKNGEVCKDALAAVKRLGDYLANLPEKLKACKKP